MKEVVAFATLFLGLSVGPQHVELLVRHDVAAVELQLDGEPIARVTGPAWGADIDLGMRLEPRRLQAVAFSDAGEELGRTEQWLNIQQAPARTEILLDTDPATGSVTARVRWNSLSSEQPEGVTALFDGVEIAAPDPTAIILPPHDPKQLHYLRVDLDFPDDLVATAERTFGGSFVDDVAAELTAVPLELANGAREPDPTSARWLRADGEELSVVEVVSGPADLLLVRDQGAQPDIDQMSRRRLTTSGPRGYQSFAPYRAVASLKRGYSLVFLRPVPELIERSLQDMRLFGGSPTLTAKDGGMFWLLVTVRESQVPPQQQRLSDALAVAAASISSRGHRRAVILLVGDDPADHSQYSPASAVHYLEQMRVPLIVWSTTGARDTPWGPAADVSSITRLERETRLLTKAIERQRIAWVRGVYLPPEVTVAAGAPGIRLAGT
jgi:hypothetical protein